MEVSTHISGEGLSRRQCGPKRELFEMERVKLKAQWRIQGVEDNRNVKYVSREAKDRKWCQFMREIT